MAPQDFALLFVMYASTSTKVRFSLLVQRPAINILVQKTQARVVALKDEIEALQAALGIDEDAQAIVKLHISLLHRYNEAKDATQILIGRLATLRNTTVRQIHEDYDLKDSD
ncbi:hypothetical protein AGABI1DRAFT_124641 [Agaricus bisporus var. burnettii JB137-S8]|uniref:Swi5-domain-containing protein n=1 Tax=Agaricus bisporus var. burnettii (strain JB137-S8 / ATCC MYA-4627 / FGSC 10392) TaxID=597362 RepID=K5X8R6_AGABU|nr:uncharacterized protein AGABI1DRAFT_124641 [Agaricus bisporus var. burnettii JB137-S8]EKM84321.1 hypothetical protein AGABI1DRAFT_124641 [Agaricus bisporus var. burnettii JB137-S8]